MLKRLIEIQELCGISSSSAPKDWLKLHLIKTIKETQDKIDALHDAHSLSDGSKRFMFEGQSITYTVIAEHILFIQSLKSVLVELVVFGEGDMNYTETVYDMVGQYECDLVKFETAHGR